MGYDAVPTPRVLHDRRGNARKRCRVSAHGVIVSLQRIAQGSETWGDVHVTESNQSTQYPALQRRSPRPGGQDGRIQVVGGRQSLWRIAPGRASLCIIARESEENGLQEKQSHDASSLDATIRPEKRTPTDVRTTPERSSLTAAKQQRRELQESAPCPPQASLRCVLAHTRTRTAGWWEFRLWVIVTESGPLVKIENG